MRTKSSENRQLDSIFAFLLTFVTHNVRPIALSSDRSAFAQQDLVAPSTNVFLATPWANTPASQNGRDSRAHIYSYRYMSVEA